MKSFEESIAWQRAMDLNEAVDIALSENKNWGFRDQLFRASLSICNNIAEGHEMPTKAHQLRYLWIAKGSCNEVCSMLHLARRRKYFPPDQIDRMMALQDQTARLLRTYIKTKTTGWRNIPGAMALLGLWFNLSTPYFLR
ncbi:MAG: four helix bundle protein [Flavobacteriales bacterium]|nr:four helix bundle protein [Flavobacteriales bacterium]MBK7943539.1 four helix bundle protein [Flavobacteriales bacterium]MBK9699774.1 four helix bundle protein [Flavobacteriales bacterium]